MKLNVLNTSGKDTGRTIDLKPEIFGIEPNDHAIYLDVKQYMANQRQGTHKSKQRAEIAGSTRKLLRQKGTGGARHGSIKAPIYVGGGRVFGPQPRDYSFKLNKKVKQLARLSALSHKAKDGEIMVIEDFNFEAPKTKDFLAIANNLKLNDKKLLLILPEQNINLYLSSRNLKRSKVISVSELNTYDIINNSTVLFFESSLTALQQDKK